jgi:hypothetical protein
MKNLLHIMLLLIVPFSLFAQTPKYVLLSPKDPLLGEWEWVKDPTGAPYSPVPETDFTYMKFSPGDSLSIGSINNDESKGLTGHCYFLAYTNGSTVFGSLTGCSSTANNGKTFRFNYEVTGNELVITVKGEQIYYRRKN